MRIQGEFNENNYGDAFIDDMFARSIPGHYSVDTNIILRAVGIGTYTGISGTSINDIKKWLSSARISVYTPILEELIRIIKYKKRFERMREFLNKPPVRFVIPQIKRGQPIRYEWNLIRETDSDFAEELLKEKRRRLISDEDALFIGLSWYEDSTIVSLDMGINQVIYRLADDYDINFHDPLKKLPYEFTSPWNKSARY